MKVTVNYPKEKVIRHMKNGTLLASGQYLWVKISDVECIVVGTGEVVKFTHNCMAWPVCSVEVLI